MKLLSIIVPVYNVEKYLEQCLESVTNQTYRNIEIILIDDGSTDSSGDICEEWKEKDDRIIVVHQDNKGVSFARNEGLKKCNGELICFVDADDWCEEDMYEKLVHLLSEEQSDVDAVICGYYDYPKNNVNPTKRGVRIVEKCDYENAIIPIIERDGYFTSLWNKMFKRDVICCGNEHTMFDTSLDFGEDEVWLFSVLKKCKNISFLPEQLYHWRARQGSVTRMEVLSEKHMTLIKSKKAVMDMVPDSIGCTNIFRGRIYNECYNLKVIAYCSKDKKNYKIIRDFLEPMKGYWKKSNDIRKLRKMKVNIMEVMMLIKCPRKIVKAVSNI